MDTKISNSTQEDSDKGASHLHVDEQHASSELQSPMDLAKAEARLRLKMDFGLIPFVSCIYLLAFIDRANIGNARLAGLEADLNMHGYDFNIALSVFFITYILFELPCNMICKWMGPGWFIPAITVIFGILTTCTAFVQSLEALCGLRLLLGLFEAAMMPSLVYFLSRWYRRNELTFRISLFVVAAALAGAFGGLLASAILRLSHFGGLHSWRMIFAIEGIVTIFVGLAALVGLPNRPETAIWLSAGEKELAVARLKAERNTSDELIDVFSWKKMRLGIFNPVVMPTAWIFLLNSITVYSAGFFLPTVIKTIFPDRTVTNQQLLTVPPYVLGAIMCVATSYASWRLEKRGVFLIACAPITIIGYAIFLATKSTDSAVRYGAMFLPFFGMFTYGSLTNSHVSANVVSDTARASAIAVNVLGNNIGGLVSTWAFVPSDAPNYRVGNGINFAAQCLVLLTAVGMFWWIVRDNRRREAEANGDSRATGMNYARSVECVQDMQDMQDLDWKDGRFRWSV